MRQLWYGLDGQPIDISEANALLCDIGARRIAYTIITTDKGQCSVSTVFLVLDHAFMETGPVLWETMTFNGPDDGQGRRYRTREAAVEGHAQALAECRAFITLDGARIIAEETLGPRGSAEPPRVGVDAAEHGDGKE